MWTECPIATSLSVLGRKWTLTVLRDIAFLPKVSFAQIRKGNRGLQPRTLSIRLRQLAKEELIRRVVPPSDPRHPYYELTERGEEVWPILSALLQFGARNLAEAVFEDRRPRDLSDLYPNDAALLLGPSAEYARRAGVAGPTASRDSRAPSTRTGGPGRPDSPR
jgi:DNA-binding HxlR family transcriptional regulator